MNDWNAWNGLIPMMNGAERWNPSIELRADFWNGWNRWNGLFLVTNEALAVELLERLERLERELFFVSIRDHTFPEG